MDKVKKLTQDEFKDIASKLPFNDRLLSKDYYITLILYLMKDIDGIYFKGGTALQKIFLNHKRLSEDIDFTLIEDVSKIRVKITNILQKHFKITKDKDVEGFTRLIVHYKGFLDEEGVIFIDLNKRAKLLTKPEKHNINHFYKGSIPEFSINTLSKGEMIAEKIMDAIGRNMPRNHYDIYHMIKANIPIDMGLVRKKSEQAGADFSVIKMFNKAKKLKNRWDEDMLPLMKEEVSFVEVMKTLSDHFKLKEEKERLRK